ncbi:GNAT family N-acetyltransferase [Peribacillus butanolivorans]|uniref:GNAT family N-acetyltransferase n=1 Tax=Peribacillus butanolivorans TaxID=421767 RepID=UPI003630F9EA
MEQWVENSISFVGEIDNKVVGYANFLPKDPETKSSTLSALYINPEYQGKSIGTKLLNAGIEELKGISKIFTGFEKGNTVGQKFYESKGFKFVREFKEKCYGLEFTTIEMSLDV